MAHGCATRRFHNVAAIHSRAVLFIQIPFSFAPKHSERFREPDTEVSPINSGFLASLPKNSEHALQRSMKRVVCCAGASDE
jgi:hypothetical protein